MVSVKWVFILGKSSLYVNLNQLLRARQEILEQEEPYCFAIMVTIFCVNKVTSWAEHLGVLFGLVPSVIFFTKTECDKRAQSERSQTSSGVEISNFFPLCLVL